MFQNIMGAEYIVCTYWLNNVNAAAPNGLGNGFPNRRPSLVGAASGGRLRRGGSAPVPGEDADVRLADQVAGRGGERGRHSEERLQPHRRQGGLPVSQASPAGNDR